MAAAEKRLDLLRHATVIDAESWDWFQDTGKKREMRKAQKQIFIELHKRYSFLVTVQPRGRICSTVHKRQVRAAHDAWNLIGQMQSKSQQVYYRNNIIGDTAAVKVPSPVP